MIYPQKSSFTRIVSSNYYAPRLLTDGFFNTIAHVPFLCYSLRQLELNKKTTPQIGVV